MEVCQKMTENDPRVKVFQHPDRMNHGPSASRNLGIKMAKYEYVAFLDADDYYLPGRFKTTEKTFTEDSSVDGVYESTIIYPKKKIYTIEKEISYGELLHYLLRGTYGHFHTNAITLKKNCFEKVGYFNTDLYLHQDSEMWMRLAHTCKLVAGNIQNPVSVIRKHDHNRITKQTAASKLKEYKSFKKWLVGRSGIGFLNWLLLNRKIAKFKADVNNRNWVINFLQEFISAT
jgi:glycosyltransferase involved in cell wall biosynthesis